VDARAGASRRARAGRVVPRERPVERDEPGLSGWVRNEPDGSVTLEIEGPHTKVDALVDWCRQGPPGARVDNVVILTISPTYDRSPFAIKG
jgi:acylphosphatase